MTERPETLDDMTIYDEKHVSEYCKPGNGAMTCAYLMRGPKGWSCAKRDQHFTRLIALRIFEGTLRAAGDNCDGWMHPDEIAAHEALLDDAKNDDRRLEME